MNEADEDSRRTEMQVRRALGLDTGRGTAGDPAARGQPSEHARADHGRADHGRADHGRADHGRSDLGRADPGRARRRFVQDGEVPVVVMHGDRRPEPASRTAELEAALEAERTARLAATRSLEEARATIQSLQTRLTHAELAHAEALAAALAQPPPSAPGPDAEEPGLDVAEPAVVFQPQPAPGVPAKPRSRAGKPVKPAKLPRAEPVRWWEPDYRSRKNAD